MKPALRLHSSPSCPSPAHSSPHSTLLCLSLIMIAAYKLSEKMNYFNDRDRYREFEFERMRGASSRSQSISRSPSVRFGLLN